jgi:hypothetical protein
MTAQPPRPDLDSISQAPQHALAFEPEIRLMLDEPQDGAEKLRPLPRNC